MFARPIGALAALALFVSLAACTVVVEPWPSHWTISAETTTRIAAIQEFRPNLGHGATYRVGEPISFRIRTSEDGYVTLTAIDPDGSVYVFARNVPVRGGRLEFIDGVGPRRLFRVDPPVGEHVIRAHFTPGRTDESVIFAGVRGYDRWQARIELELRVFPRGDIAETRFTVRR